MAVVLLQPDLVSAETLTYAELVDASQAIASLLLNTVRPGDRVLLAYDNCLDAVLLFWGCMMAGVVAVPAPAPESRRSRISGRRLQAMCEDAQVALAFTRDEHLAAAQTQVPHVRWFTLDGLGDWRGMRPPQPRGTPAFDSGNRQDLAYLQYTSGSTGRPRGVQITHGNLMAQCKALAQAENPDPTSSRTLTWLPWFHDYGLVHGLLAPAFTGATSYLMSTQQFLLRPLRWLEAIALHGIGYSGAPDFAYEACVNALARSPDWNFRLDQWKLATCGAEPIRPNTLRRFCDAFSRFGFKPEAFAPSYGLAEAVVAVSLGNSTGAPKTLLVDRQLMEKRQVQEVQDTAEGALELVGCGRVLPGMEVRIVHPESRLPCTANEVGEIWVRGPWVGDGYWNQPAASTEKFAALIDGPGAADPFLRTGDLGFFKGGELFVTGRYSDLIIVHGRNIHPQDLEETALTTSEWVRPKGVIACPVEHAGREHVVLLVECRNQLAPGGLGPLQADLRRAIAEAHHVDLLEVVLLRGGVLPRTSSGKLQRREARRMYLAGEFASSQLKATETNPEAARQVGEPADNLTTELAALWADVLNLPHVPLDAHFLLLGGDSLTATQLLSRVKTHWGVDLPISALFADPSLRGMAGALATKLATAQHPAQTSATKADPDQIPGDSGSSALLSYSQERMWFMQALAPASSAYNVPLALRLRGMLDAERLEQAFKALIAHHEILRTKFIATDLGPVAEVVDNWDFQLTRLDAPPGGETGLASLMGELSQQPFQLDRWPLMRASLIRSAPDDHVLLLVLHHIVADQWSFSVLGRELSEAYRLARFTREPALPGPPLRFASYAGWHRHWFEAEREQQETAYWRQRLDGLRPVALVPDRARPRQASFRGASIRLPLPPGITDGLAALAASQDATLAMALLAAFKVLLRKHTGQTDLSIGMPIANRHHPASENLIGTLVNTLIIRTSLEGDPDFMATLQRVKAATLEAYEHQDMPFELLVRTLDHKREPAQTPLFNVMFNLVNTPVRGVDFDGLSWSRVDVDRRAAQVDLTVVVDPYFDRSLVLEYATDLFEAETMHRMGRQLLALLQSTPQRARTPISQWTLLDPAQRQQVLSWGSGQKPSFPETGLAAFLEQGLALDPQATALVFEEQRLSYAELDQASRQLAEHLHARGFTSHCRIGLCLPRSTELVIALLATIRSGATYVPLDPLYPEERIGYQIEDAGLSLIIGTRETLSARRAGQVPCLSMDEGWPDLPAAPLPEAETESPAYLIYTSGSTGRPKGVCVPQHAVVNFLRSMAREPGLQCSDRVLAVTTLGFDIAVLELLLPLGVGATIVLASDSEATDGDAMKALIDTHAITLMQATPSRWRLLIEAGWPRQPGMRALVGGEPLPPTLAHELAQRCDAVWNMYGPTETTVWSSCWRVQPDAPISLGQAIDHTQILVLDEAGQLTPAGAWGEIWIGGAGVADGYWQRPELTGERFRVPACLDSGSGKAYRTGDRGRWRHDGSLEHGGRLDDQVKLRGFRIELGEIEAFLSSQTDIQHCVATVREDSPGDQRLVAYIVTAQTFIDVESLRVRARQWLPDPMVPTVFMQRPALPVLPNGKIDRKSLPMPADNAIPAGRRQAPRNETEQRIWFIWQDLLQHGNFGVDDNFFDLGGHSMLAARMVRRIQTEFHGSFSLSMLFEQPTVSGVAQHLMAPCPETDIPAAVLRHGQQPGLFLLAGAQMYQELARQLTTDMSVHGLFSQAEIDLLEWPVDQPLPPFSIETLASAYVDIIRALQPHGPYYLGGFSIGGVLAYEVAQRLIAAGEQIGLLAMLDCALPGRGWKHLKAGIVRRARMIRREGFQHFAHLYRQVRVLKASQSQPGGRRNQVYAQAILQYKASASAMPVAFFQAAGDTSTEPAYGWDALAPNMVIELVPGKHSDILEAPNVSELARHLSRHLASAKHAALVTDS